MEIKENLVTLFKNKRGNVSVVLPDGFRVMFANGQYYTENKRLEAYLTQCAETGDAGIYIDPERPTIDTLAATPMEQLHRDIRRQVLEELRQSGMLKGGETTVGIQSSTPHMSAPAGVVAEAEAPVIVDGEGDVAKGQPVSSARARLDQLAGKSS